MSSGIVTASGDGVNPSTPDRCPSWNTHTIAPTTETIVAALSTSALTGRTTDPVNRNSSTKVVSAMSPPASGSRSAIEAKVSTSSADGPPTRRSPGAGTAR